MNINISEAEVLANVCFCQNYDPFYDCYAYCDDWDCEEKCVEEESMCEYVNSVVSSCIKGENSELCKKVIEELDRCYEEDEYEL